jgi:signal transduction histidine kinase
VLIVRAGGLRSELDYQLTSRLAVLAAEIRPLLEGPELGSILESQLDLSDTPLVIRSERGTLIYRAGAAPALEPEWDSAAQIGVRNSLAFQTVKDEFGRDIRLANHVVVLPTGKSFVLQLMSPVTGINEAVRELALVQAFGILLILAIARYGSAFTARKALAPIDEIIRRGRDIQGKELGKRLEVEADTIELERLVSSLNQMLDRLEEPVHTAHRFAANVSHELQTPITAMRFALEAAQRSERPEQFREIAGDMMSELDRLSTLIRDLRLLAVAGAGQLLGKREDFDLGEVTEQCCEIARAVGEGKDVEIDEHIVPGLTVTGSALHLRRVILNLTDNAIRYSPAGSTVRVEMGFGEGEAFVRVKDSGCGISEEDLPRIFEPFFRADRARARETGGSGLGLAIAEQVVRAHQGHITVESEPNRGSTFTVYVPATPGA